MKRTIITLATIVLLTSCGTKEVVEEQTVTSPATIEQYNSFEKRLDRINQEVIVTCVEKGTLSSQYEQYIVYKFQIKNQTDKEIRAVKGYLTFNDIFGEEIKTIEFVYDRGLEPRQELIWEATTTYNQFMSEDIDLKSKDLKDMTINWRIDKVIYNN